jgi:hypothetical protein
MNYLIKSKRARFALSVNPEPIFHIGHLYGLLYTREYAKRNKLEFHLRYDDTYVVNANNHTKYPNKDSRWENDITSHKPGCGIYEMLRPSNLVSEYVNKTTALFDDIGIKFDKKYILTDMKKEIPRDTLSFLEFIPFFFYEDAIWSESVICRGMEWDINSGEYRDISKMQFMILDYLKCNYKVINFNLIKDNDIKISKSDGSGNRFNILNFEKKYLYDIIDIIENKIKGEI